MSSVIEVAADLLTADRLVFAIRRAFVLQARDRRRAGGRLVRETIAARRAGAVT